MPCVRVNEKRGLWQGYLGGEPSDCTHLVTALFEPEEYHSSLCLHALALQRTTTTTTIKPHGCPFDVVKLINFVAKEQEAGGQGTGTTNRPTLCETMVTGGVEKRWFFWWC
mmetsp:Transcript_13190/g.23649  ORF Transcript_13190/g.23649 Transcript_13190/m.23649 type:complete len:111 (-) Transcript_13190:452-784(-)